jgi:hypothetical protein
MPEHFKGILNKLLLAIIIGGTLLIPSYIGMAAGYTMGHRFMLKIYQQQPPSMLDYVRSASNPRGIIAGYRDINTRANYYKQFPQYRKAYFNAAFDTKFYGPLIAGAFLGLFTLFLMRAQLMDFRPYRRKEKIHGDAKWSTETRQAARQKGPTHGAHWCCQLSHRR